MKYSYITDVQLDTSDSRLRIQVLIVDEDNDTRMAELPQREMSTLLPKTILLGDQKSISCELLSTIHSTLVRLITGRAVRTWEYQERLYCGFLSWRNISCECENATHIA
ncbi:MAG: hypothetical protein HN368_10580 [Spirochaetales bacterium]|jgi:hypothetical protein|nr:hypothetical protein [Spirochaetales bacterium]